VVAESIVTWEGVDESRSRRSRDSIAGERRRFEGRMTWRDRDLRTGLAPYGRRTEPICIGEGPRAGWHGNADPGESTGVVDGGFLRRRARPCRGPRDQMSGQPSRLHHSYRRSSMIGVTDSRGIAPVRVPVATIMTLGSHRDAEGENLRRTKNLRLAAGLVGPLGWPWLLGRPGPSKSATRRMLEHP
jgi:hypothetical protein